MLAKSALGCLSKDMHQDISDPNSLPGHCQLDALIWGCNYRSWHLQEHLSDVCCNREEWFQLLLLTLLAVVHTASAWPLQEARWQPRPLTCRQVSSDMTVKGTLGSWRLLDTKVHQRSSSLKRPCRIKVQSCTAVSVCKHGSIDFQGEVAHGTQLAPFDPCSCMQQY
jgi:hypothetical protein